MKRNAIIGVIVVVLVVGVGAFILGNRSSDDANSEVVVGDSVAGGSANEAETPAVDASTREAVIMYTDTGFSPTELTVKDGTTVTVKNESSSTLDFASDDHPSHKINGELNVGDIEPGKSASFTAKVGTWGYHNHRKASATGTLTVEE